MRGIEDPETRNIILAEEHQKADVNGDGRVDYYDFVTYYATALQYAYAACGEPSQSQGPHLQPQQQQRAGALGIPMTAFGHRRNVESQVGPSVLILPYPCAQRVTRKRVCLMEQDRNKRCLATCATLVITVGTLLLIGGIIIVVSGDDGVGIIVIGIIFLTSGSLFRQRSRVRQRMRQGRR